MEQPKNNAGTAVSAHATAQEILQVSLWGPMELPKYWCRCSCLGPEIQAEICPRDSDVASALVWAREKSAGVPVWAQLTGQEGTSFLGNHHYLRHIIVKQVL